MALVEVEYTTAYNLSTCQTPKLENPDETRVHGYLRQLREDQHARLETVRYLVTGGYSSKKKFTDGVVETGLHPIGKLRLTLTRAFSIPARKSPVVAASSTTAR